MKRDISRKRRVDNWLLLLAPDIIPIAALMAQARQEAEGDDRPTLPDAADRSSPNKALVGSHSW